MNPTDEKKVRSAFDRMREQGLSGAPDVFGNSFLEKPLPSSAEAERCALGGILLDNRLASELFFLCEPDDFYSPLHKRIAKAIHTLHFKGENIDPILIGEELKKEGSLESIGGIATITNLSHGLPHFSSIKDWATVISDKSLARMGIKFGSAMVTQLLAEEDDVRDVIAHWNAQFTTLQANKRAMSDNTLKSAVQGVREIFQSWQRGIDKISTLHTGIPELDEKLKMRGLATSELTLIAARPSIGKTALLLQIASHVIRLNIPVLFVSLEMLKERLVMRMLPPITDVKNKSINPALFQEFPDEAEKLFGGLDQIEGLPMHFERIFDLPRLIATIEYYITTKGVKLVVFDYLQLIKSMQVGKFGNRDNEVGLITHELKEVGVRTNTAILGAAQLNRDSEKEHRRPRLADLRESGAIEQAADTVLFPYDPNSKENFKYPELIENSMLLELYCAKQRDGARHWSVDLLYNKDLQKMESAKMRGVDKLRDEPVKESGEKPSDFSDVEKDDDVPF